MDLFNMNRKIAFLIAFVFSAATGRISGQEDWKLKSDKDGVAIYLRSLPDSKFKAIKVECEVNATLSQMVAVLLDIKTAPEWVYSTKSCILLKQVSPSELYYYSEVSIPWPASNRDFIAHLITVQDPQTKVVTVYGPTAPDLVPVKEGIVRVRKSEGKWVLTPAGRHTVKILYTLHVDPGGNIPAWLVNMFATKGPYESFRGLKLQLQKPAYANVRLSFIKD
jgi:hypothetical protein